MTEDLEQSYLDKIYKKNCEIKKLKEESDNWEYKKNKYQLIVSNAVLTEYYELLAKFYSNTFAEVVIDEILNLDHVILQEPYFKFELIFPSTKIWYSYKNFVLYSPIPKQCRV